MATDRPGDHPLTDVLIHERETYGPEADELIRGISEFSSRHELYQWWNAEINWSDDRDMVLRKAQTRFTELLQRSRLSGFGSP